MSKLSSNSPQPDANSTANSTKAPRAKTLLSAVMTVADGLYGFRSQLADAMGAKPTIVAYTGYGSTEWVRVLARVVKMTKPRSTNGKVRGWRAFTSVPIAHSKVDVEINGTVHSLETDAGGLIDLVLDASLDPGWNTIKLSSTEASTVEAPVFIVDPATTFGIVSDIDDTVMVTALPRPFLALWNTLVLSERARTPTPGMAVMLDRIMTHHPTSPVLYLSTGAWNVAPALSRFLARNLYPAGALLLTDWGPTRQRWFRSGQDHKNNNLRRLAKEFPDIRWLLIGDDGQHDPEIYKNFVEHHAAQTAAVAIRELSPGEAILAGNHKQSGSGTSTPSTSTSGGSGPNDVVWVQAPDGAGLEKQLNQHRIF